MKVERKGNAITYYRDDVLIKSVIVSNTGIAALTTRFTNANTVLNTVRVNKKIAVNKDITTQVLVSVKKDAQGGYTPKVTLGQTINATTGVPASTIRTR